MYILFVNAKKERGIGLKLMAKWLLLPALQLSIFWHYTPSSSAANQATQATVTLNDGSKYTGQLVNGISHGQGRIQSE